MSVKTLHSHDAHDLDYTEHRESMTALGFWLYLMTDLIVFATLFATYIVLLNGIADGPAPKDIFSLPLVLVETFALLLSSITYGMSMLAAYRKDKGRTIFWLIVTFLFGFAFICIELHEFRELISHGFGPERSGFLSAFFALVGTHGLHVAFGLVWMVVMMIQVFCSGLTNKTTTRLLCLSLFWHFLDIVWICVFTIVYLLGVAK